MSIWRSGIVWEVSACAGMERQYYPARDCARYVKRLWKGRGYSGVEIHRIDGRGRVKVY